MWFTGNIIQDHQDRYSTIRLTEFNTLDERNPQDGRRTPGRGEIDQAEALYGAAATGPGIQRHYIGS